MAFLPHNKPTQECLDLVPEWNAEVYGKGEQIDPGNEFDWFSLAIGFAIGRGLNIDNARKFAFHVSYEINVKYRNNNNPNQEG